MEKSEPIDFEEEKQKSFPWTLGIKLPQEFKTEGKLDFEKLSQGVEKLIELGITSIEIPHNIKAGELTDKDAEFLSNFKKSFPSLKFTVHENVNNIFPYDWNEYKKEGDKIFFEPHLKSKWAEELGRPDIGYAVKSACNAISQAQKIGASVVTIHPIGAFHGYAPKEFIQYDELYFSEIAKYLAEINKGSKEATKVSIENFVFPYGQAVVHTEPENVQTEIEKGGVAEWHKGQATDFTFPNLLEHQIQLVDAINSPYIGFTLDIGHAFWSEQAKTEHIIRAIRQLSERAKLFHVHAHDTIKGSDRHLEPGQGEIPFGPIIEELKKQNYTGIVEIEVNEEDAAIAGAQYIEKI